MARNLDGIRTLIELGAAPTEVPAGRLHDQVDALRRALVPGSGAAAT